MIEEWKQMVGHPKFLVSNLGRISNREGKIFSTWVNHEGYEQVCLCEKGKKFVVKVHKEVAKCFIQPVEGKPIVNHIDGVKTNNNVENLEWSTYSLNAKHALLHGLANAPDPVRRKVRCVETGEVFASLKQASEKTKAVASHISACCSGERKTTGGLHWEYVDGDSEVEEMKVKRPQTHEEINRGIKAQLVGLMKVEGLTAQDMADKFGVSLNTFYRHRDNPEMLTLREIRIIQQTFPGIVIE